MKLTENCPECGKIAKSKAKTYSDIFKAHIYSLECGHVILEKAQNGTQELVLSTKSKDDATKDRVWDSLRDYQRDGVQFLAKANYKALLADDMGLGKTWQAVCAIRYAPIDPTTLENTLQPCLVVVKAALKNQWAREIVKLAGSKTDLCTDPTKISPLDMPFIIWNAKQKILPGFKWYIISMDTLFSVKDEIIDLNCKCAIIDESQAFKDGNSKRTKALLEVLENIPHRMCLSGTPILNRAAEYFVTLNLLDPRVFWNAASFKREWVNFDYNRNRYTGILDYKKDKFKQLTEPYVLRRLRNEVLTELPEFSRYLEFIDIEDPLFKKQYKKGQKELSDFLEHAVNLNALEKYSHILALLSKLRQLVGMAKVPVCCEIAQDFLDNTDRKLVIGAHHRDVINYLSIKLRQYNPVQLTGSQSSEEKDRSIQQLENNPECRLMIASTLAAGEGLNLQFCSDVLVLERQWNAAKEIQFEGRFNRMGQLNPVQVRYLIAKNSLDEWLTELIEAKKQWTATALSDNESECYSEGMNEEIGDLDWMSFAETTAKKGF